ncbi:MAG: methyltransferase domain-containing protein [Chitinispirillaceae bacterium]|nr:methyltransferase domain-containing protein [Chitinispirillaceae bacterium]
MDFVESRQWRSGLRHPWERARLRVIVDLLSSPGCRIRPGSIVADIGSGDAFVIKRLSARFPGARFLGVDTALDEESTTESSQSVTLFRSLAEAAAAVKGSVSHVLLLDVLEHVPDERRFMRELLNVLPVDGAATFLVTVPAFQWLFSSHDEFLRHYRRYARSALCRIVRRSGLSIEKSGYFFSSLLVPRALRVVGEKLFPSAAPPQSDLVRHGKTGRLTGDLMEGMLVFDYRIGAFLRRCGIQAWGLSVFALCRKAA